MDKGTYREKEPSIAKVINTHLKPVMSQNGNHLFCFYQIITNLSMSWVHIIVSRSLVFKLADYFFQSIEAYS